MFVGHYGVSFAAKRMAGSIPLWVLFVAVQFLDVLWAPLVLAGIEKVRIAPGTTASNPLDLYYMPYTHSLVAALFWSGVIALLYRFIARPAGFRPAVVIAVAVFSHWILDFVVHRPDLPIYDNAAKIGLGLWNRPALAFGLVMLAVQAYIFFGPPPVSDRAAAWTALGAYAIFAVLIWWLQDRWEA
jgi:hypothetical protein